MKKIVVFIGGFTIFILVMLIIYTNQGRNIRQIELNEATTSSLEKVMQMMTAEPDFRPSNNEEMMALFLETFLVQISSNSTAEVNFLVVDAEKGLMSVECILEYVHPIGTDGRVSCVKTVMLEQYNTVDIPEKYNVQFLIDGELYKMYTLVENSAIPNPGNPVVDGKTFKGWSLMGTDGVVDLTGLLVDSDKVFVGVFQ